MPKGDVTHRNVSSENEKEIKALRLDEVMDLVRRDIDIGYKFKLAVDTRGNSVSSSGLRSRYKPGNYKVIGLYPYYILTERIDLEAKEKTDTYVESAFFTRPVYISKESFSYMEMYLIITGKHPALEENIQIKSDLPKGWKKKEDTE